MTESPLASRSHTLTGKQRKHIHLNNCNRENLLKVLPPELFRKICIIFNYVPIKEAV